MRKLSFYPKLAAGNLWRNRSTYLPYMLACITCIITFYSLMAINNSGSLTELRGADIVQVFTAVGAVILAIFCVALLFWTNSFLIKRRKKELGLYSILGMEKRNIALVMFFETLFIGLVSLFLGIFGGVLLSRLIFLVLLKMIRFETPITLHANAAAIANTAIFFLCIFALTLLSNLRQVRMAKPIEMMAGAKQGEKEPRASILITIIGILSTAAGYVIAIMVEDPQMAILLFLVAAFLVIIGTYCLFTSGSIAVLKLMRKKKSYYYTPKHFISVSGMIYRMKQNAAGLATICILSCMVLVTVGSTTGLYSGMEDVLERISPHDYLWEFSNGEDEERIKNAVADYAQQSNVEVINESRYEIFSVAARHEGNNFEIIEPSGTYGQDIGAIFILKYSDYFKSTGMQAEPGGQKAFLYHVGKFNEKTIIVNGHEYELEAIKNPPVASSLTEEYYYMLVLPDEQVEVLKTEYAAMLEKEGAEPIVRLIYNYGFDVESESAENLEKMRQNMILLDQETVEWSTLGYIMVKPQAEVREGFYRMNGGFLFLGCFFGLIFLMAAVMIIYYKQLSEGYDDVERFDILQKVGMSKKEVQKTIFAQVRSVFFLPLIAAMIHITVAFIPVRRAMTIFGVTGFWVMAAAFMASMLVYALVYVFVYRKTAKAYLKIVSN